MELMFHDEYLILFSELAKSLVALQILAGVLLPFLMWSLYLKIRQ
jgi:Mn2+/Fe2+ NRAMP family transporter